MREVLSGVVRNYSPHSDIDVKDHSRHIETIKQHRRLAKAGQPSGMPTLIPSIDYHWDGLIAGRLIGVLGRPGEGKSLFIAWVAWVAMKLGYRIGIFSPEMNEFEHRCRLHTLASADPEIQKACGLKKSFRNRDLMRGTVNLKQYNSFLEYFETLPGFAQIFTKVYRRTPLTVSYVASKVEDLGLHGVIADPLSKLSAGARHTDNPVWEDYEKVNQFQEMGEEQNIFCVATNWSNRNNQRRKNEEAPDLDESFGSDALAKESDHVIGVKYDPDDRELILRCSKSRFGLSKFRVHMECHPNTGFFHEVNIPYEVASYKLKMNGNANPNGNGGINHEDVKKVIKAKPGEVNDKASNRVVAAKRRVVKAKA